MKPAITTNISLGIDERFESNNISIFNSMDKVSLRVYMRFNLDSSTPPWSMDQVNLGLSSATLSFCVSRKRYSECYWVRVKGFENCSCQGLCPDAKSDFLRVSDSLIYTELAIFMKMNFIYQILSYLTRMLFIQIAEVNLFFEIKCSK